MWQYYALPLNSARGQADPDSMVRDEAAIRFKDEGVRLCSRNLLNGIGVVLEAFVPVGTNGRIT